MTDVLWIVLLLILATAFAGIGVSFRVEALRVRVEQLEQRSPGWDVRRCRDCGCTDDVASMTGCWWVEDDLCSSCDDDRAASGSSLEGGRR